MNIRRLKKDQLIQLANTRCVHRHTLLQHPECIPPEMFPERIGFLDLECSNLSADFGIIFSYAIKPLGEAPLCRVVTTRELRNGQYDRALVGELCETVRLFDTIITYYGTRFDIPFARTRALVHGLDFPLYKEVAHRDLYFAVRGKLRLSRNRLENACRALSIGCKGHPLEPNIWFRAMSGDRKALEYILAHNLEDVVSLEQLYLRLDNHTSGAKKPL